MTANVLCFCPDDLCEVAYTLQRLAECLRRVATVQMHLIIPAHHGFRPVLNGRVTIARDIQILAHPESAHIVVVVHECALLCPNVCPTGQLFVPLELQHVGTGVPEVGVISISNITPDAVVQIEDVLAGGAICPFRLENLSTLAGYRQGRAIGIVPRVATFELTIIT